MCVELGLATGAQNQYDAEDWHKCVVVLDSRFVFVSSRCQTTSRERSTNNSHRYIYEIAFAPRSRKYGSSECRSARCKKKVCLAIVCKVVCILTRSIFAHTKHITDSVDHCLFVARIVFLKKKRCWPPPYNGMHMLKLLAMHTCVSGEQTRHISSVHAFHES